jgi:GNAT superfamily N-acetyltransferase
VTVDKEAAYRFADLSSSPADAELLTQFYDELYVAEFPDPDEREALANMLHYLEHDGEHGNAYIVTLMYAGEVLVGGAVADYFVRSECGAIEFLTIAPSARGCGLGAALAAHVERRIADAATARTASLALVMAEINDPLKRSATPDNVDPFERLRFWDRLGYRRVAFPYVQPALSPTQSAVTNLLLAAKPIDRRLSEGIPATRITTFLSDYLVYAMRFEDPNASPEFVAMRSDIERRTVVRLVGLAMPGRSRE